MSRVINPDSTGKKRNQNMRACAELLRHLMEKQQIDNEAQDMLAAMVFAMREIDTGIDESATAWEKRDYWMKAEQLRQKWAWVGMQADELEGTLRQEVWDKIPPLLAGLLPHFADITIAKFTRESDLWEGQYNRLMAERS
jgi:hypothetical protein